MDRLQPPAEEETVSPPDSHPLVSPHRSRTAHTDRFPGLDTLAVNAAPVTQITLDIIDLRNDKSQKQFSPSDRIEHILEVAGYKGKRVHAYFNGKKLQSTRSISSYGIPDKARIEIRMCSSAAV